MTSYYPPAVFHFKVEFTGVGGMSNDTEQRFQEVSGLSFEIETEEIRVGGENRSVFKLPKRIKYPNLVLKRGLLQKSAFLMWLDEALGGWFVESSLNHQGKTFVPADLMITLMDEKSEPVAKWNVRQAYPLKWSISDFKANSNDIAVESIELAYQYFERKM